MTNAQRLALDSLWEKYGLNVTDGLFDSDAPLFVDIGFGMGESLLSVAQSHPQHHYIGIEVYRPGVGTLLAALEKSAITNVRIYNEEATIVLTQCIMDKSLDGISVFFPDPWPKSRHRKRRLIQPNFVALVHQKLKPNGLFYLATDWEDYAHQMMKVIKHHGGFYNKAEEGKFSERCDERPPTKYEKRGERLGYRVYDLCFVRE